MFDTEKINIPDSKFLGFKWLATTEGTEFANTR